MLEAFLWGLVATSSLIIGGIIAIRLPLGNRALGMIMGFGAGALISAVSYELVFEGVTSAVGSGYPVAGLFAGTAVYYLTERALGKYSHGKAHPGGASRYAALIIPMVLAIILDGIPESIVIGLGIFEEGHVSLAMLVAVFISNIPEAIAGSTGMKLAGWSRGRILVLWIAIALICALASLAGFTLFAETSDEWLAFIYAFAGGAVLIMLANSMIPESYEHGGRLAGLFTVIGFAASVAVVVFEHIQ